MKMEDVSFHAKKIQDAAQAADQRAQEDAAYEEGQRQKTLNEEIIDNHRTAYANSLVGDAMRVSGCHLSDVQQAFMTELVKSICLEIGKSRPGMF